MFCHVPNFSHISGCIAIFNGFYTVYFPEVFLCGCILLHFRTSDTFCELLLYYNKKLQVLVLMILYQIIFCAYLIVCLKNVGVLRYVTVI